MADTSTTPAAPAAPAAPAVTPGNQTSEYKVTIIATALSVLATVTGVALDLLQSASDAGVTGKWMSIALSVFGLIGAALTAIGYQVTRARVKAAASAATTTVQMVPADAAAKVFAPQ